jgi:hypothetical protein
LESYNKWACKPDVVRGHGRDGNFLKTSATSKGATLDYLACTAWGLSNNYICRLKKKAMAEDGTISTVLPATPSKSESTTDNEQCAVISNRELAKSIYTAKKLFALNKCRDEKNTNLDLQGTKEGYNQRLAIALDEYDNLTIYMRDRWEMEARGHDEQQPLIKGQIIEMLQMNPKICWEALELHIHRWWCASTIRRRTYGKTQNMCGTNYQARKWPLHMFNLTGLHTKLSKQRAITNFLAQVGASIVGSETISNLPKLVLNERIRRPLVLPIISYITILLFKLRNSS